MFKMRLYSLFFVFNLSIARIFSKPNILFITVDDLRPNIGIYGDSSAVTPNIDRLAGEGVVFKNAFAQQALCGPSRTSFLTSRRPHTLHTYDVHSYWRTFIGNFTTLPQYFKQNSYYTKSIGKVFHPGKSSNYTDDYPLSWSIPAWHPSTEKYKNEPVCRTKRGWFSNLICPVKVVEQPEKTLPDIQSTNEAIKFIKSFKEADGPFFLAVGYHKPHIPFKFPKRFADLHPVKQIKLPGLRHYPPLLPTVAWNPWNDIRLRDDVARLNLSYPFGAFSDKWARKIRQSYYASVSYIDHLIGQLLDTLKATRLHMNTIIILLGDHGWSLGEHGEWSKYSNFDVALRVPLIFRIPGLTYFTGMKYEKKKGVEIEDLVELIDVFPTVVALAGLPSLSKCPKESCKVEVCTDGMSLLPLIKHGVCKTKSMFEEKFAFSQYPRPGTNPTKFPDSDQPKLHQIKFMGYSIRTRRYRYTEWVAWNSTSFSPDWSKVNASELYDHQIDPNENLNLIGRPQLKRIQRRLSNLLYETFEENAGRKECTPNNRKFI